MKTTKHLTDEQIALYVDALKLHRVELLCKKIKTHAQKCPKCAPKVLELFEILLPVHYNKNEKHPTLRNKKQVKR